MNVFKRLTSAVMALAVSLLPLPVLADMMPRDLFRRHAEETAAQETDPAETVPPETKAPETEKPAAAATEPAPVETAPPETVTEPDAQYAVQIPVTDPTPAERFEYEIVTVDGVASAVITGYTGYDDNVVIPHRLGGYPVVKIGVDAFCGNYYMKTLVIPEGVTEIAGDRDEGSGAFSDCDRLAAVSLPRSLTRIGAYAFESTALTELVIPGNGVIIEDYAFRYCEDLRRVEMTGTIRSIGDDAFYGCDALQEINLPEGLTDIGEHAFSYTGLQALIIPESVTSIGAYAFEHCEDLEQVILEDGWTTIDPALFDEADVVRMILPDTVTTLTYWSIEDLYDSLEYIRWSAGASVVPSGMFRGFTKLETVILPEGVTQIADSDVDDEYYASFYGVFSGCENLTSISLPSTLTAIGTYAFYDCAKLEAAAMPEGLTDIGDFAFAYTGLKRIDLPASLRTLGENAFYGCASVEEIEFGGPLERIGDSAFGGMENLKSVSLPAPTKSVGESIFGHSVLEELILEDS